LLDSIFVQFTMGSKLALLKSTFSAEIFMAGCLGLSAVISAGSQVLVSTNERLYASSSENVKCCSFVGSDG